MERKTLFIINPISGGKKKDGVPELIGKYFGNGEANTSIVFSDGVNHARLIAKEAVGKFDLIVAVGGDGTVNEVASALSKTNTTLGIIPYGSGNGLARFLSIPMDTEKAITLLLTGPTETIDSGTLNGMPFFNMAGMGFDAHISKVFSGGKTRGFFNYIRMSFIEFKKYNSQNYSIYIDGVEYERKVFMLSFANSSQYGNNAHISPNASVQDGLLDVCFIQKFPFWRLPEMGMRMLFKAAEGTKYVNVIRGKHISVKREIPGPVHIDGEPQVTGQDAEIDVVPHSIKVVVGTDFKVLRR